jgi:SPP1 family predicted phage head-tail adaptor
MSAPTIGAMRMRLMLEAPVDVADDSGSMRRSYASIAELWGEARPTSGASRFIAEREEQSIDWIVRMRWRADVTSRMRLVSGARILLIHSVYDPDGRRRFLFCRCEEISI